MSKKELETAVRRIQGTVDWLGVMMILIFCISMTNQCSADRDILHHVLQLQELILSK